MSSRNDRPLPPVVPRMKPFWAAASVGRLTIQRCAVCSRAYFPAVDLCNECLEGQLEWIDVSGKGVVFSYVVMHQVYHAAFAERVPYAVAEIKLDEGPRMVSNVVGCPPDELHVGMPVEVIFEKQDDTISLPLFRAKRS